MPAIREPQISLRQKLALGGFATLEALSAACGAYTQPVSRPPTTGLANKENAVSATARTGDNQSLPYALEARGESVVDQRLESNDPLGRTIRFWLDPERSKQRHKDANYPDPDLAMEICSGVSIDYRLISYQNSEHPEHPGSRRRYLVSLPYEFQLQEGERQDCQTKWPIIELEKRFEGFVYVGFIRKDQARDEAYQKMWTYDARRSEQGGLAVIYIGPRDLRKQDVRPLDNSLAGYFIP